ncbi:mucin-5AC [Drosophila innubila]|uniref:mucin-5AC n=1 Tax=Drosophila innubila TaxID=198719 RepID=UPI00148C45DF|nr:mucin-5AC [Drosophila innubila]
MKLLCSVLILASVALSSIQAKPSLVQTQLQGALDKYLVNANARNLDISVSPDVTSQCFALYLPILNEVAATFSSSYQACITTANNQIASLTTQAQKDQLIYQQEVHGLCSAFTSCDNSTGNDTTKFFNCYATAAQGDVSVIYDIATNAASTANTLAEAIKATQDTEYQCTNTTESNYVRDTAATYDLLDSCLRNGVPTTSAAPAEVTTAGVTVSTQSTPTTSADASTSSTDADSVSSTSTPADVPSTAAAHV